MQLPSERHCFAVQLAKRISPSMHIGPLSAPFMLVPVMAMAQVGLFISVTTTKGKRTAVWPKFLLLFVMPLCMIGQLSCMVLQTDCMMPWISLFLMPCELHPVL